MGFYKEMESDPAYTAAAQTLERLQAEVRRAQEVSATATPTDALPVAPRDPNGPRNRAERRAAARRGR